MTKKKWLLLAPLLIVSWLLIIYALDTYDISWGLDMFFTVAFFVLLCALAVALMLFSGSFKNAGGKRVKRALAIGGTTLALTAAVMGLICLSMPEKMEKLQTKLDQDNALNARNNAYQQLLKSSWQQVGDDYTWAEEGVAPVITLPCVGGFSEWLGMGPFEMNTAVLSKDISTAFWDDYDRGVLDRANTLVYAYPGTETRETGTVWQNTKTMARRAEMASNVNVIVVNLATKTRYAPVEIGFATIESVSVNGQYDRREVDRGEIKELMEKAVARYTDGSK